MMCDAYLVATVFYPNTTITKSRLVHADIELTGKYTRGQLILNHLPRGENNVKLIDELSVEGIKKAFKTNV